MNTQEIHSMTGFGSSLLEEAGRRVTVEARSVNHRFLKLTLKLPEPLRPLQPELEEMVRSALRRGSVSVLIRYLDPLEPPRFTLDARILRAYHEELVEIAASLGQEISANGGRIEALLGLPGSVCEKEQLENVREGAPKLVRAALKEALEQLLASRSREGVRLKEVLLSHADRIQALVEEATKRAARIPGEHRDRLLERVLKLMREAAPQATLSEPDLLREVCLLADRLDVTEELGRLQGHLEELRGILRQGREVGRRLDFLTQELNREANTIGSKANDGELARTVVELKCEVERVREQVQNLE